MSKSSFVPPARTRRLLAALGALTLSLSSLCAENVFVTAYKGGKATDDATPCPPSCTTGPVSVSGSSASSSASPAPVIPASGRRSRFATGDGAAWSVTPMDVDLVPVAGTPTYHFSSLQHTPGVYKIYVTKGTSGNASTNLVVDLTVTGGDLADTNGVGQSSIELSVFQRSQPNNVWIPVGYITNSQPDPTITFAHVSGFLASLEGRWYMDAVWFEYLDPCTGVATEVGVAGPLAEGQTFVNVTGVSAGATLVTVYADTQEIGSTNYAAGFAAGQVMVPTTALVKGARVNATQGKPNAAGTVCSSDPGPSGIVGGGPNPPVTAFITCWSNAAYAGPIGANSTPPSSGYPYFLKSSGLIASYNTAPVGGTLLTPSQCWQTATFLHGVDGGTDLNSGNPVNNTAPFASLEGLVFSINDSGAAGDTGPYEIYVDAIMNGDTLIEGFEGYDAGAMVTFNNARTATQPTAASTYLPGSDSSAVSRNFAYEGTNACRLQWQFSDGSNLRWSHFRANAGTGKTYPQLDTSKPITVRYLVLPVGVTTANKFNGTVGEITGHTPAYETATNTLSVAVTGGGDYTYQWSYNGAEMVGADASSLVVGDTGGLNEGLNGTYSVAVSDGTCTEVRTAVLKVQTPIPTITRQPAQAIVHLGSTASVMSVSADGHVEAGYPLSYQWRCNGVDLPDQTEATLSFPVGADLPNVGSYEVVVGNSYGQVTSLVATLDVVPEGIAIGSGTGLRGDYRILHYSTNAFSGAPTLSRVDATLDFDWAAGAPATGLSADDFTARWTGRVQALGTDFYTFSTISDDGVRLWLDGQLLIDNWTLHASTTNSALLELTGTQQYDLTLEFFERGGSAVAKLYWSNASGSVGFEPVPTSQLYPAAAGPVVRPFSFTQPDATHLQFNWGVGQYNVIWAANVTGPYTNIIYGVTSPFTVPIGSEPQQYFRLQVE